MTGIGHNSDAFTIARDTLAELLAEARQWLDGEPIQSAEQAQGVRLLQERIREQHKEGDTARMAATKPHRDAEKAINDQWRPVLHPAKTALDVMGQVLGRWQAAEARARDEAARIAREEAAAKEHAAQEALRASSGNLAEREAAKAALAEAQRAATKAKRLVKASVGVRSVTGGRASALVVTREPVEIVDGKAALQWAMRHVADDLRAWLLQAAKRHKGGDVPGVRYQEHETVR